MTLKQQETARLDKWLWAVTVSDNKPVANGQVGGSMGAKPSRTVKIGDTIHVRKPPITYSFKILNAIETRVGAKFIPEVYENVTDAKQYELLEMSRISGFVDRAKGTGRPTKKDRRAMESFVEPALIGWEEDDEMFDLYDE